MSNYQRLRITGGCYFFTVVTWRRRRVFIDDARVQMLRDALRKVKQTRPFQIDAMVVLPDHLHCIWRLPENDADYSSRWREIKKMVSRQIDTTTNARQERLVCGSADFGNTLYATKTIGGGTWTIFITIQSNTDWCNTPDIGRGRRSPAQ
ncbi:transposase [Methylomicrobium album BG8]|uniref:Transposase n=1 Tax=Methylomicrobium album BG8 TaxID=686340 RepID=H8GNP0_METAL|nr:transposase [Methylomicrobium album BG8]